MQAVIKKIEAVLNSCYDIKNYVDLVEEIFPNHTKIAPERVRPEYSNFSSHKSDHTNQNPQSQCTRQKPPI